MTEFDQQGHDETAHQIEICMTELYGPLLTGENLSRALGYPSQSAFRKSISRNTIPIPVFTIEKRKGKFALTKDVANWLASKRNSIRLNAGEKTMT